MNQFVPSTYMYSLYVVFRYTRMFDRKAFAQTHRRMQNHMPVSAWAGGSRGELARMFYGKSTLKHAERLRAVTFLKGNGLTDSEVCLICGGLGLLRDPRHTSKGCC